VKEHHRILNPCGKKLDLPVCESKGHLWVIFFVHDIKFKSCKRCERLEREDDVAGHKINTIAGINIKDTIA